MNREYNINLRCATCGRDDKFEFNDDKSYVKCNFCNREYFGGYDELLEMNQTLINEKFDEINQEAKKELVSILERETRNFFCNNKYIKIK